MPARLTKSPEHFLELEIIGYEFPSIVGDRYDANWLMIRITVVADGRSWTASHASLLTWEVHELAEWLRGVAERASDCSLDISFIEPRLAFEREQVEDMTKFSALLNYELRPPELRGSDDFDDVIIEFTPTPEELRRFADRLESGMQRFPIRTVQDG
ncbi:MAG: hypothetical protein EXR51_00965 [Dehalococcoidia bacterium]|nr:hypothetical protein [Dehalococcoidia bacterium]